jgi:hypothetical protein
LPVLSPRSTRPNSRDGQAIEAISYVAAEISQTIPVLLAVTLTRSINWIMLFRTALWRNQRGHLGSVCRDFFIRVAGRSVAAFDGSDRR